MARELGDRNLGLAATFIWAVFLPTLRMEADISGDFIASFFVVVGTLYFVRAMKDGKLGQWAIFGFMFGLAVLSRSSTLLIVLALFAGGMIHLWFSNRLFNKR